MRSLNKSFHYKAVSINDTSAAYFDSQLSREDYLRSPVFRRVYATRYTSTTVFRNAPIREQIYLYRSRSLNVRRCYPASSGRSPVDGLDYLDRERVYRAKSYIAEASRKNVEKTARNNTITALTRRAVTAEYLLARAQQNAYLTRRSVVETVRGLEAHFAATQNSIIQKQGALMNAIYRIEQAAQKIASQKLRNFAREELRRARAEAHMQKEARNGVEQHTNYQALMVPVERLQKAQAGEYSARIELYNAKIQAEQLLEQNSQLKSYHSYAAHFLYNRNEYVSYLQNKNAELERYIADLQQKYQDAQLQAYRAYNELQRLRDAAYEAEKIADES